VRLIIALARVNDLQSGAAYYHTSGNVFTMNDLCSFEAQRSTTVEL
jgi:hypothetical protein